MSSSAWRRGSSVSIIAIVTVVACHNLTRFPLSSTHWRSVASMIVLFLWWMVVVVIFTTRRIAIVRRIFSLAMSLRRSLSMVVIPGRILFAAPIHAVIVSSSLAAKVPMAATTATILWPKGLQGQSHLGPARMLSALIVRLDALLSVTDDQKGTACGTHLHALLQSIHWVVLFLPSQGFQVSLDSVNLVHQSLGFLQAALLTGLFDLGELFTQLQFQDGPLLLNLVIDRVGNDGGSVNYAA